ncbi:MAG: prephenate dehydrogenase [Eubacteriales bacterium]|nr:prephenate dehydrogenase [Eubacteriales bacterium]
MCTIGFIGLGLIGGSLAKSIHKVHPDYALLAFDPNKDTLASAVADNIINGVCEARDSRFAECDFIFLCAPVETNLEYLAYFRDTVPDSCILSDVGSVKGSIHDKVKELNMSSRFIGGHPMAGSERTGFENSSDHLFENAYYILTPGEEISVDKLSAYTELVSSLAAIPMVLTAQEHDYITAGVSHLPHLIASSLVNLVKKLDTHDYMKAIAAGGFKDITRIASSSPVMWQQICLENDKNISFFLDEFIRMLIQVRLSVDSRDSESIYEMFASSRDYRDSIDETSKGLLHKAHVLYCDIVDEAGGIATIATILAMDGINIKNIGIIHNREFEEGVLKIAFYDEQALSKAVVLLKKRNYIIYER